MEKVCAVVVTYNRKKLLLRNIESVLMQDYPVDVLIYDNASTDGTYDCLKENGYIDNERIIYIRGEKNGGGSYGFCNGEKEAVKRGYGYLWLMDDDGYCVNNDTLKNLMDIQPENKKLIRNSYVLADTKTLEPTFDLGEFKTYKEIVSNSVDGLIWKYGNPYNGTLVPRECFEKVGFTDERFFIYGDENDFFLRTSKAGYTWVTPIKSLYYHPINRKVITEISFMGLHVDVKDQPVWKHYLEVRNDAYLKKTYANQGIRFRNIIRVLAVSLLSKNKRIKRIYYGFMGLKDGTNGFFDRPIMFDV